MTYNFTELSTVYCMIFYLYYAAELFTEWILTYLNYLLDDFKPIWTIYWITFNLAKLLTGK